MKSFILSILLLLAAAAVVPSSAKSKISLDVEIHVRVNFTDNYAFGCTENNVTFMSKMLHSMVVSDALVAGVADDIPPISLAQEIFKGGLIIDHTGRKAHMPDIGEIVQNADTETIIENVLYENTEDLFESNAPSQSPSTAPSATPINDSGRLRRRLSEGLQTVEDFVSEHPRRVLKHRQLGASFDEDADFCWPSGDCTGRRRLGELQSPGKRVFIFSSEDEHQERNRRHLEEIAELDMPDLPSVVANRIERFHSRVTAKLRRKLKWFVSKRRFPCFGKPWQMVIDFYVIVTVEDLDSDEDR